MSDSKLGERTVNYVSENGIIQPLYEDTVYMEGDFDSSMAINKLLYL